MKELSLEQKRLLLNRQFKDNPAAAFLLALDLLSNEMDRKLTENLERIKASNRLEMKERIDSITAEIKKDTPNLEKILNRIHGDDGEDSDPEDVADALLAMPEFIAMIKPQDGKTPTKEELLGLILPLIPKLPEFRQPVDGKTPTDKELLRLITPLIPKVKDGKTPTKDELVEIVTPIIEKIKLEFKPVTLTGEEAVRLINELALTPDKQIDFSHLKNVPKQFRGKKPYLHGGGIPSLTAGTGITLTPTSDGGYTISSTAVGSSTTNIDLSSQLNGVLRTFNIPGLSEVVSVHFSSNPFIGRPTTHYTVVGEDITFTTEVPIESLTEGQVLIVVYNEA